MNKYWEYFKLVLNHKYHTLIQCYKLGIIFRGLTHDLSKFLPDEFIPYAKYFACPLYGTSATLFVAYDKACDKHHSRNKHHWQYWRQVNRNAGYTGQSVISIPEKYLIEMLADWIAAGIAYTGKNNIYKWYYRTKDKRILDNHSIVWLEEHIEKYKET